MTKILWHISNSQFKRFDPRMTAQGIIWFAKDGNHLVKDLHGASVNNRLPVYLYRCEVKMGKVAGWDEYDKKGLGQLRDDGFDTIELDDDVAVLNKNSIRILGVQQIEKKEHGMTASESKCKVILPPEVFDFKQPPEPPVVFLAGSIDQGEAPRWDLEVIESLEDVLCVILNPRRKDWDKSWKQDIENDKFREQVEWELKGLEQCSLIALCLTKDSKAPISLLEMGLHISEGRMIVFCPEGFYRKGNVDIVCERYGVSVLQDFEDFKMEVKRRLNEPVMRKPVTASDRMAWRIIAKEFIMRMSQMREMVASRREAGGTNDYEKTLHEAFHDSFVEFKRWCNPRRCEKLGYKNPEDAWDANPELVYRNTGWTKKASDEVLKTAMNQAGMGDTHPFGSPLRGRPDYGERDGEVGEKYGLKLPSDGIMTSGDNNVNASSDTNTLRVRVITDRIVAMAKEFTGSDRWDGEIQSQHMRFQWVDGRERQYRLTEMPMPGKKRLRVRSGGFPAWLGGSQKREYGFLLMANVASHIKASMTYEQAALEIDRQIKELVAESNGKSSEPKPEKDLISGPWETLVFYLEVEPADMKPFVAEAKDFKVSIGWDKFEAYDPSSDFEQSDPSYTKYQSKSPTAARKMYKVLNANPDALKNVSWSDFSGWLRKNGISYDSRMSQWH